MKFYSFKPVIIIMFLKTTIFTIELELLPLKMYLLTIRDKVSALIGVSWWLPSLLLSYTWNVKAVSVT